MSSASSEAEGPQTPEDVERDQPGPEIDELGRIRVANNYRINPVILVRLSQIFETNRPRAQQSFFCPWIEISNAAKEVLGKLIANKNGPEDIDRLRILESGSEVALSLLANSLPNLESALAWVEEYVADPADRSDIDGSDNLAAKHSREGGLFRRWIQTFPEVELGTVQSQSEFTEGFVDAVSGDEDIVEYRY
ncbi:hypothetical protein IG631_09867 [Alternaria alternata]|nr:hypothetical protein IG631_09867 [Alternaria alternata]